MNEELEEELKKTLRQYRQDNLIGRYVFIGFLCLIAVWLFVGFCVMLFNT